MALPDPIARDLRFAALGGALGAGVALAGGYVVGTVSGLEAVVLIETSLPTTRFLASSTMTASATILALMLTLLSLSHSTEYRMRDVHYRRVKHVALADTVAFVASAVFLLLLNIPIEETENVPTRLYSNIYYGMVISASVVGGLLIAVVLMLYQTVRDVIETIRGDDPGLLAEKTEGDEEGDAGG